MLVLCPCRSRAHGSTSCLLSLLLAIGIVIPAWAQTSDQPKAVEGFGEARRGDVPEGTLEMMTPQTDEAIKSGLEWLSRAQNSDGSYGNAAYRGNIAVTSLAGLAFMASGSSPGRGTKGDLKKRNQFRPRTQTKGAGTLAL